MKRFEESITIQAPAERVYDYVSDFPRHSEWAGHGLHVSKDSDGPVAVGTTYSTTAKQFGTQREHSTLTELSPGKRFAWDSKGTLGLVHHWFAMSQDGASTTLMKGAEFAEPSFLAKMMGWRLSRDVPKSFRSDLTNIKARLETPTS